MTFPRRGARGAAPGGQGPDLVMRAMTPDDLEDVEELYLATAGAGTSPSQATLDRIRDGLRSGHSVVAERGGQVVGHAHLRTAAPGPPALERAFWADGEEDRGTSQALIESLLAEANRRGYQAVTSEAESGHAPLPSSLSRAGPTGSAASPIPTPASPTA